MMIVCEEDDSGFEGKNSDKAFFVDECSGGMPWTEFGKWFGERWCGSPSIIEQMHGMKGHHYKKLTKEDLEAIKLALEKKGTHERLNKEKMMKYLEKHIDKGISTENW